MVELESIGPKERQLRLLMAVYCALYFVFGMVLLFYPRGITRLLNLMTDSLGIGPPLDLGPHPFWAMVCVSLLLTLSLMCFLACRDVRRRDLIWIMIFAKYVSSICQVGYLVFSGEHPPGFGLGAIVDAFLGTVALIFVVRADREVESAGPQEGED